MTPSPSVAAIVPGTLYAVGVGVPERTSVSWIPPGLGGWMPVQCFLFRNGAEALLLDSGLGVHRDAIAAGIAGLLAGATPPRMLVSRWEPDAMVNLPWMIDRFGIAEVLSFGGINPLDFFTAFETSAARSLAEAASGPARLVPLAPGELIRVGALRIEVLTASLRLLLTSWFYEHTTRSLFTADSFGFLANPTTPAPFVARPAAADLSPAMLSRSLLTKFDWLAGAHCETLAEDLRTMHDRYAIERVCPSFGGVIEGAENVSCLFASAIATLTALSRCEPRSAVAGFDWPRAMSNAAVIDIAQRVITGAGP